MRWYVLELNPEPWAIGPVGINRRNGMHPFVGPNKQLQAYQEAIREELGSQEKIDGPVKLTFYFWRQRAAWKDDGDRKNRRNQADATNMQKALEDALQGILFENDRDVNDVRSVIVEQGSDVMPRIVICCEESHEVPDVAAELPPSIWDLLDRLDTVRESSDNRWGDKEDIF